MICARCGQSFEPPVGGSDICGTCADDLRAEEDAMAAQAAAEAEEEARQRYEAGF